MHASEVLGPLDAIEVRLAAPPREYLRADEAAGFLGLFKQRLDVWRMEGGGPPFHKVGRRSSVSCTPRAPQRDVASATRSAGAC
ncbi:MAG: hypothetical protein AAF495_15785 [Pseudomonadota bacterium]